MKIRQYYWHQQSHRPTKEWYCWSRIVKPLIHGLAPLYAVLQHHSAGYKDAHSQPSVTILYINHNNILEVIGLHCFIGTSAVYTCPELSTCPSQASAYSKIHVHGNEAVPVNYICPFICNPKVCTLSSSWLWHTSKNFLYEAFISLHVTLLRS